jgi:hypothetical protein
MTEVAFRSDRLFEGVSEHFQNPDTCNTAFSRIEGQRWINTFRDSITADIEDRRVKACDDEKSAIAMAKTCAE